MKIKIINILGVMLLGMIVMFSSCEDKDDYDYKDIDPAVQAIVGPLEVRGGLIHEYRARGRGGSTYDFTNEGAIDLITVIDGEAYGITADFLESFDDKTAKITVIETTMGGKSSEPFSIDVNVTRLRVEITGEDAIAVIEGAPVEQIYNVDFKYPGASYKWTVSGQYVEIIGADNEAAVKVQFNYPDEEGETATINVAVTTTRNNVINKSFSVLVEQFCPLVIEEMLGGWVTGSSYGDCPITAVVTEADEENVTITMMEVLDFYTICTWGDDWEVENGLVVHMNEPAGTINIPVQFYGYSNYPESFWIRGVAFEEGADYHGVYNFCGPVMTIKIEIIAYWAGGIDNGVPVDSDGNPVDPDDLWDGYGMFANPVTLTFTPGEGAEAGFGLTNLKNMLRNNK